MNNGCLPPVLSADGTDYLEWKVAVRRWATFTKYTNTQWASVVSVKSLSGEARSLALSISDEEIGAEDGLDNLIAELDTLYLNDEDTLGYEAWRKLIEFKRCSTQCQDDFRSCI